jgi:hypothetical protein
MSPEIRKKKVSKEFEPFESLGEWIAGSFLMEPDEKGHTKRTPPNVKDAVLRLQELARKYRTMMSELQEAYIDYQQEWIISEPTVYVARTKDKKNDHEYFTAKTFWPTKDGKRKEVKIYLGKAEEFGNDTMSVRAREYAKKKMSETLRRRKDSDEI